MPAKRRAPVMKVEKNPAKYPASAAGSKNPDIDGGTIIGNPDGAEVLASLFNAVGAKVVTVKGPKPQHKRRSAGKAIRPDNDDPSGMLGPLVPDDPEDDDDDTPGGM